MEAVRSHAFTATKEIGSLKRFRIGPAWKFRKEWNDFPLFAPSIQAFKWQPPPVQINFDPSYRKTRDSMKYSYKQRDANKLYKN